MSIVDKYGNSIYKLEKPQTSPIGGHGISVNNAITLDATTPIPIEINSSMWVDLDGQVYVPFLGSNDRFGQTLTEVYHCSVTQKTCINSKADFCVGYGIVREDGTPDPELEKFFSSMNNKRESMRDIMRMIIHDRLLYGNSFPEIVKGEVGGKRFVKIYRRNFLECRLSLPDRYDVCKSVYISKYLLKNYSSYLQNAFVTDTVNLYQGEGPISSKQSWSEGEDGNYHTMFHLSQYEAGYNYYGLPYWLGALWQSNLEYKATRYNLDNFENNMVASALVSVKSPITDVEKNKLAKQIINKHTGDGNRGRVLVVGSEQGNSEGIDIHNFDTQKDGSYVEFDIHNTEKIFYINRWNKLLVGGSENKNIGSGNASYIQSVWDIALESVIKPEQAYFIEKFLVPFLEICDEWLGTKFSQHKYTVKQLNPISYLSGIDVNSITTVNEGRKMFNMEEIEDERGEAFIKSGSAPKENEEDKKKEKQENNK